MNELKKLLLAAAQGKIVGQFSSEQTQEAAQLALAEHFKDFNPMYASAKDFAIIAEVLEETTPAAVQDIIGRFAEVKTFGYNDEVVFNVKNVGGKRVMQGIVPGARAGIYKARRLDNNLLNVTTNVETVGWKLSVEDLITGRFTIKDYVDYVTQGFVEKVYTRMIQALRAAAALAPAANRSVSAGASVELKGLDRVIRIIAAYGTPTIFAFESAAGELGNVASQNLVDYAPTRSSADLADIRNYGYVTVYRGRQVVVLPNFLADNTNANWVFNEDEMFVLPADEKPIKVAFHGNLYIAPFTQPNGNVEFQAHRSLGVAVVTNNAIGSYKITDWDYTGIM